MKSKALAERVIPFIVIFIGISQTILAQEILFDEITNKDGLNSNQYYYYVFQDSKGFMWMANLESLQRYDGYSFRNFERIRGGRTFMEDSRGCIWIGSDYMLYLLDPETESMAYYRSDLTYPGTGNVIEDKDGTIWAASQVGLVRLIPRDAEEDTLKDLIFKKGLEEAFDITIFRPNGEDYPGTENRINRITIDSKGRLWVGASTGLYVFERLTEAFIPVTGQNEGDMGLSGRNILNVLEEKDGVIWVRTVQGLTRISALPDAISAASGLHPEMAFVPYASEEGAFLIDSRGNFWLGSTSDGLIRMHLDENFEAVFEKVYTGLNTMGGIECSHVSSILEDRTGLIWTAHQYPRIRRFREGNSPFTRMEDLLGEYPDVRYDFNQILEDEDGNQWICTWGTGLLKRSTKGNVTKYDVKDPDIQTDPANNVLSVLEVQKGIFWVSTYYPARIYRFDAFTGAFQLILSEPSIHGTPYWMYKTDGHVIIGTETGIWSYDLASGSLTDHSVRIGSTEGLRGTIWVAGKLMESGNIYWCSDSLEIVRFQFDPETASYERHLFSDSITHEITDLLGRDITGINIMHEDRQGNLWIQIQRENLLIRFNLSSGEIRTWNSRDGITGNRIATLAEDRTGNFWYVYDYGLSMIDATNGMIRSYDANDGLPIMNQSRYASVDSKGMLYFGGMGSLYRVDPEKIHKNEVIPNVVITGFRLFNIPVEAKPEGEGILDRNISYADEIRLRYNQHDISFAFSALDYSDPEKNRYAYRLEGYQEEWIETGADNRLATYTNLSPGTYTFRVRGSNNDGVWNQEGTFLRIVISPPFWKTALAYVVYGIIILLLMLVVIRWRTKRLTREKRILEDQVAERTRRIELQKEELLKQKEALQSTLENLKKTQDQLIESEKMAAVGGLVAGVAHEINTPVGIGITAITNMQEEVERMAVLYEKDEISRSEFMGFLQSSREATGLIRKNLERTASLVQSLKQVSVDQVTEQKRVFLLNEYLHDILLSLKPKFASRNIDFIIECDESLKLHSYPGVFAQIFTNLLINSVQHGFSERSKGRISIAADVQHNMLRIRYTDDGNGISKEDLPHIFEPFFTSDEHLGTGLGMHIVYNLVRQKLQGSIDCKSEAGHGVLFTIEVPVT